MGAGPGGGGPWNERRGSEARGEPPALPTRSPYTLKRGSVGGPALPSSPQGGLPDPSLMLKRGYQGAALRRFLSQAHEKVGVPCWPTTRAAQLNTFQITPTPL